MNLEHFWTLLNYKFDIIAFSETKLQDVVNISLPGYRNSIHTFTEAFEGGVCFYIHVDIDFKPRNDLKIYEIKKIESLFIEIINKNGSNAIVGVLYIHPSMDMDGFNDVKTMKKNKKST